MAMEGKSSAVMVARYGMLIALAMVFSFVETLIPLKLPFGIKLGLANLVNIVGLYTVGLKGTAAISLIRILLVGFTFGNMFGIAYSLAGGVLSLLAMAVCKKRDLFSQTGVSVVGGISHNIGQLTVAALVVEQAGVFYYFPVLLLSGLTAGLLIGLTGDMVTKRIQKFLRNL